MEKSARRVPGWGNHLVQVPDAKVRRSGGVETLSGDRRDFGATVADEHREFDTMPAERIARRGSQQFDHQRRFTNSGVPEGGMDLARAAQAVADLLDALGVDRESESLADTPARVARAYAELLTPEPFETTTFPNDEGYDELVVARDIPFSSLCEHHLLPFAGVAHVGYLPGARLLGLSKLARIVTHYSRRLQVQERLTTQVADWLVDELDPKGVGVVLEAEHACMSMRGVRADGARTVTSALAGLVRNDQRTRSEFLALVRHRP
jgi:GTP cyclohydrolase IA